MSRYRPAKISVKSATISSWTRSIRGEDIGEQGDRLVVDQPVVGQDVRAAQVERRAVHIGATASGFADQQNARGDVPGIQAELPEHIQPSAGDISQIERRGSGRRTPCDSIES